VLLPLITQARSAPDDPSSYLDGVPATYFGANPIHPAVSSWPRTGFGALRAWGISWREVQTSRTTFAWEEFDAVVAFARQIGMDLLFVLGEKTPAWAADSPTTPPSTTDWRTWVQAVVHRANGGIRFWEILNEPNFPTHYTGDIATLVELADIAHEVVKGADASLQVVSPSPSAGTTVTADVPTWMDQYLTAGGDRSCDIVAFHGYRLSTDTTNGESIVDDIAALQAVLSRHGQQDKPLWNTESSWSGAGVDSVESSEHTVQQAAFLAKYYLLHWSLGVQRLYWYAPNETHRQFQLWSSAGGLNPAGRALQVVSTWLSGAHIGAPVRQGSTWSLAITRPEGYEALAIWDATGGPTTYRPDARFTVARALDGTANAVSGAVTLTLQPLLLEAGS
jgi:Glycosyl hydrolase family 10